MEDVDALLVAGYRARQADRRGEALGCFERAAALEPGDVGIRLEVARSQLDLAERRAAVATLEVIAGEVDGARSDDESEVAMELGRVWALAGEVERALAAYRSLPIGASDRGQAVLEAVMLLERAHRLEEAEAEAARHPGVRAGARGSRAARRRRRGVEPSAALAQAVIDERAGDWEAAVGRLREVWERSAGTGLGVECGYRLARLLDAHGEPGEALDVLAAVKSAEREAMPGPVLGGMIEQRRRSDLATLDALPGDWFASRVATTGGDRAVVLGHPRSGTSLLARGLAKAGRAAWVDECPAFGVLAQGLLEERADGADTRAEAREPGEAFVAYLASIDDEVVARFGVEYAGLLAQQVDGEEPARWIDKNPGLSQSLPALHRLLPGWAWVHVQRDPRDVAVSCYFQRFGATPLGWACGTLEGAAGAVLHAAAVWERVRAMVPAGGVVDVRYEAVVASPEAAYAEVAGALGWGGEDGAEGSGGEGGVEPAVVQSPTYAAVRGAVTGRAVGRWRRHESAVEAAFAGAG